MDHVRVLTVCSGNICRSPLAELMLADGLRDMPGYVVQSAGTVARDGDVMPPEAQRLATRAGLDSSGHRARFLTEGIVSGSDLIFAMSRSHRSEIVRHDPSKISKTFTIREFARLSAGLTDDQLRSAAVGEDLRSRVNAVARLVFAQKATVPPVPDAELDDVIDPYRRSEATYERSSTELTPAVNEVVRVLRLAGTRGEQ